jgi:hypothetical protein
MRTKATCNKGAGQKKETRYRRGFHEERVSLCAGILAALLTSALTQHEANFDHLIPEEDSLGTFVSKKAWLWCSEYPQGILNHVWAKYSWVNPAIPSYSWLKLFGVATDP